MPPKYSHVISAMLFAFAGAIMVLNLALMDMAHSKGAVLAFLIPCAFLLYSMAEGCYGIANLDRDTEKSARCFNAQSFCGYMALVAEITVIFFTVGK